jgi:uncharacterized protein YfkK (UPF0435 family)
MATPAMDMEDMDTMDMAMARGRLRPMLLLRLDTIMDTPMDMVVMDTTDMVMARERPRPRLDTPITDMVDMEDMVDMDIMDMVMARERPRLRLDTPITDMVDMEDMVVMDIMDMVMARGRLSPVIIMDTPMDMAMEDMVAMDTMVKQQLFICPTNFSKFDLDLSESSQKKHTPDIKNIKIHSLKIKDKTNRILCTMFETSFSNVREIRLKSMIGETLRAFVDY